jgi:hypothetical protein
MQALFEKYKSEQDGQKYPLSWSSGAFILARVAGQ